MNDSKIESPSEPQTVGSGPRVGTTKKRLPPRFYVPNQLLAKVRKEIRGMVDFPVKHVRVDTAGNYLYILGKPDSVNANRKMVPIDTLPVGLRGYVITQIRLMKILKIQWSSGLYLY